MKIFNKISYGIYLALTKDGGCLVDAVCQISAGDNPLISVALNHDVYSNELFKKEDTFIIAVLSEKVDSKILENFGFRSSRDFDKYEGIECMEIEGIKVPKDVIGYMVLKKEDSIDNDTHTLFIGRYIDGKILNDEEEMTYKYYQEHKDELIKVKTESGKTAWICTVCGYVYYGKEVPDDFKCPICGVGKEYFKKQ